MGSAFPQRAGQESLISGGISLLLKEFLKKFTTENAGRGVVDSFAGTKKGMKGEIGNESPRDCYDCRGPGSLNDRQSPDRWRLRAR
jgi:hypothetical protein